MNKKERELVKKAAEVLIATSEVTTTLQIKKYLRVVEPNRSWFQDDISKAMIEIESSKEIPGLKFDDNGQFREYSLCILQKITDEKVKKVKKPKVVKPVLPDVKISRSKMVKLMKESKGSFMTVTFKKIDNSVRVMNGNVKLANFMNLMGYINFKERNGDLRQVNPKTLISLKVKGQTYVI